MGERSRSVRSKGMLACYIPQRKTRVQIVIWSEVVYSPSTRQKRKTDTEKERERETSRWNRKKKRKDRPKRDKNKINPKLPFFPPVAAARILILNQAKPWDEPPLIAIITGSWGVAINHSLKPRHACRNTVRLLAGGIDPRRIGPLRYWMPFGV